MGFERAGQLISSGPHISMVDFESNQRQEKERTSFPQQYQAETRIWSDVTLPQPKAREHPFRKIQWTSGCLAPGVSRTQWDIGRAATL
jgi:hypothetical protein